MKLKKLIQEAAKIIGIDVKQGNANWSILFRCANLVVSNIACNYEDCTAAQTFNVKDGEIKFTDFDRTFLKIKSVKSGGYEVPYDFYINSLRVPNGIITVEYAFIPKFTKDSNVIKDVMGRFDENVLLYGILAEYCFISSLKDEAKYYNDKFESLLFASSMTGKARVIPC
jgi:hypothetical protein